MIRRPVAALLALAVMAAGCAARAPVRPAGTPVSDPTAVAALTAATAHCRPLRTATAEIVLSGRVGADRVRGRLVGGFAAPSSLRLEAVAPFGAPALLLASDGATTTLLFPRDRQVLREASVAEVLDAITGLALGAGELRDVLFGCLATDGSAGQRYNDEWQAVDADGVRVYLQRGRVAAADYRGWLVDYAAPAGGGRTVRVRRTLPAGAIDLTAVLSQVQMNVELPAEAFTLAVPADAAPITLDDLRAASPLAPQGGR
jgi:outer membrane lipoprotein-sorting protein